MSREIIEFHHVRVDIKAFDEYHSYEYDVEIDRWHEYEKLNGKQNVSCFDLPNDLYNRLNDDENEPRFYDSMSYEVQTFNSKIVREKVSWQYK
jgi:hypothetical protein